MVKFFADDHNARFVWSWVNGEYTTDDSKEIENYKGIGLRFEEVKPAEEKPARKRRTRKPKVD